MEAAARKRNAIVALRVIQFLFGVLSLVFVWKREVPWQALMDEQAEQHIDGHTLLTEVSSPLQLLSPSSDSSSSHKGIKDIIMDVVAGGILFAMSVVLLWRNEGHSVRIAQLFDLAKRKLKEVPLTANPNNLRELVCVSGDATTQDTLTDNEFKLAAPPNTAKMRAKVWMYQWVETKKDNDNTTTYSYAKKWCNCDQDSSKFHTSGHTNPKCPRTYFTRHVARVCLGDYMLPQRILGQMQDWSELVVSSEWIESFRNQLPGYMSAHKGCHKEDDGLKRPQLPVIEFKKTSAKITSGSEDSSGSEDNIGDIRLSLEYVPCGSLTVVGVQTQKYDHWTFVPLQFNEHASLMPSLHRAGTKNTNLGDSLHDTLLGENEVDRFEDEARNTMDHLKHGITAAITKIPSPVAMTDAFLSASAPDEILFAVERKVSGSDALKLNRQWETKMTHTIRLFAVFLMYGSIMLLFSPLRWVFAYLWIVGSILHGVLVLSALVITCCCSSLTISLAYCVYRPLVSIALIGGSGALLYIYSKNQESTQS